ncbi:MAG: ABC transporter substrate-binding protein [Bacteroidales bacterium]|nr:ABC transporter substrate-binding protein [Bacteroidales bacterium]MDY0369785.1 ABC transporter substrate-binding protein [Bacteroidales bacterium]
MSMIKRLFGALGIWMICSFVSSSCNPGKQTETVSNPIDHTAFPVYAKGFKVEQNKEGTQIFIYDPYEPDKVLQKCVLGSGEHVSEVVSYPDLVLDTIRRVVTLSATQWGPLIQFGKAEIIKGISEAGFVKNTLMKTLLNEGKVIEVAYDANYKLELLADIEPDLILVSPDAQGLPSQLLLAGFPLLAWTDYYESDPLGRAEWIRLIGLLSGCQAKADSIFFSIAKEYNQLKELVASSVTNRPTVFADKFFSGQWYIPAGQSYMAQIFNDAGADYLFADIPGTASVPLDIEVIIQRSVEADYWRIAQAARTYSYEQLAKENEIYSGFAAFKNRKIIYCNTTESAYFEESPLHPHWLLADFIAVFHPDLLPEHIAVYHKLLD